MTKKLMVLLAVAVVIIASSIGDAVTSSKDAFRLVTLGPRAADAETAGGEPSIDTAPDGTLYVSYPSGSPEIGMGFYRSVNDGASWIKGAIADTNVGDTTVNIDQSGAVYQSNLLNVVLDPQNTLQADIYKSFDGGASWPQKGVTGTQENPSSEHSSNSTFLVDRQWVDAYIPPGKTTNEARVYLTYHDFVAGVMWINVSKDGGKTFSEQRNIITDPEALANSVCNVIPGGLRVPRSGPHAGRVYVVWLAGNVATNAPTGCNYTQMDTFGQVWAAYSDDEGDTWTNQLIYDAGVIGHDASYLFADLALDRAGNPYVTFALNDGDVPHTGGEGDQWNIFVSASFDGGTTWNGASDGTGAPYKVTTGSGTHVFPAVAAGDPGRVVVAYIATDVITPQLAYGKAFPAGDPDAKWDVYLARSLDFAVGTPTWTTFKLSPKPIHTGDVCNLGLFCSAFEPFGADRSILDFIDVIGDPDGMVHVAYTDTELSERGEIVVANQISGTPILTSPLAKPKPRIVPKLPRKLPPRVLGKGLAATGVTQAPLLAGTLLVAGAAMILRRLRRAA